MGSDFGRVFALTCFCVCHEVHSELWALSTIYETSLLFSAVVLVHLAGTVARLYNFGGGVEIFKFELHVGVHRARKHEAVPTLFCFDLHRFVF